MKPSLSYFIVLICIFANPVTAHHQSGYHTANYAYARVVNVKPVYRLLQHRVPQQHCWIETIREDVIYPSATATLVGGLVGGAIGHAAGHGHDNKKFGTVVGSLVGMSVGHDISQRNGGGHKGVTYRDVEHCEIRHTIETERKLVGYDVTYEYRHQQYRTHTQHHPGKRIRVAIGARPY